MNSLWTAWRSTLKRLAALATRARPSTGTNSSKRPTSANGAQNTKLSGIHSRAALSMTAESMSDTLRTLAAVDQDLTCERAILIMERRAGNNSNAANDSRARIDQLLEERLHLTHSDDCDGEVVKA